MTQGINRLLQRKDPDLVGVFSQLGYVDEPRLSAVLAANYASSLQVGAASMYGRRIHMVCADSTAARVAGPGCMEYVCSHGICVFFQDLVILRFT